MADRHKHGGLSWHPPGELSTWVRAEAERRGVPISTILNEALEAHWKRLAAAADTNAYNDAMEARGRASCAYAGEE